MGSDAIDLSWGRDTCSELCAAILSEAYEDADRLVSELDETISDIDADRCLQAALQGPVELFARIAAHCPSLRQATGRAEAFPSFSLDLHAEGCMMLLAAVLNQTEHMQFLLAQGCSVNGVACAREDRGDRYSAASLPHAYLSDWWNTVFLNNKTETQSRFGYTLPNCTPLAAAILAGSTEAVELLIHNGAWLLCNESVCQAIALRHENPVIDGCASLVMRAAIEKNQCLDRPAGWLQPQATVCYCTPGVLRRQLEQQLYTASDAREALHSIGRETTHRCFYAGDKLQLLVQYFPEVCREPWARGIILREIVRNQGHSILLRSWHILSSGEGELSPASTELAHLDCKTLRYVLNRLKEQETALVLDADSVESFSAGQLTTLLSRVRLLPSQIPEGISAFAVNLLDTESLHLISRAISSHMLAGESTEGLLQYYRTKGSNSAVRALLLAGGCTGQKSEPVAPQLPAEQLRRWHGRSVPGVSNNRADYFETIQRLIRRPMPEEEQRRLLLHLRTGQLPAIGRYWVWNEELLYDNAKWGTRNTNELLIASCCGNGVSPALLMEYGLISEADTAGGNFFLLDNWQLQLHGSALCWTVVSGNIEKTAELLKLPSQRGQLNLHGINRLILEESQWGVEDRALSVTPLACAILQGEVEAAKLLYEHGAQFDLRNPEDCRFLREAWTEEAFLVLTKLPQSGWNQLPASTKRELAQMVQKRTSAEKWADIFAPA